MKKSSLIIALAITLVAVVWGSFSLVAAPTVPQNGSRWEPSTGTGYGPCPGSCGGSLVCVECSHYRNGQIDDVTDRCSCIGGGSLWQSCAGEGAP